VIVNKILFLALINFNQDEFNKRIAAKVKGKSKHSSLPSSEVRIDGISKILKNHKI
jgi:hypothetical protein